MIALKDVVVAVDFSGCSDAAIEEARLLADQFGARLHLLHVVDEPLHDMWANYASGSEFMAVVADLESAATRQLDRIVQNRLRTTLHVVATTWGDPCAKILEYAGRINADLIVCGTHGRTGWDHVLMGSVAERLVRLAACPVLTVHASPVAAASAA
jgi:universal stress protein A